MPQSLPAVPIHIGNATLQAEIAATDQQGEIGLMYRRTLPDNDGMLFVLPVQRAVFWMKNTLHPAFHRVPRQERHDPRNCTT